MKKKIIDIYSAIKKKRKQSIRGYIDFDKRDSHYYNNIYLDEFDVVIKMPLFEYDKTEEIAVIDRFSLSNRIFLLSYDYWSFIKMTTKFEKWAMVKDQSEKED